MIIDAVFLASCYIVGAAVCRTRHADMSFKWGVLYTAVFGVAAWSSWEILQGSHISLREVVMILMFAVYIFLTRHRWDDGVPEVARRV